MVRPGEERRRGSAEEHSELVAAILVTHGSRPDVTIWKNATGVARSLDGKRKLRFGLVGSADILGIRKGGQFLAIECKTGNACQTKEQRAFQKMIEDFGGTYILARSLDDVVSL